MKIFKVNLEGDILNMKFIKNAAAYVLDMDGTFYLGNCLLPGAVEFLEFLNQRGIPFCFLTNNSSKSPKDYQDKLIRLGVKPDDARVYTSGDATIAYLKHHYPEKRLYLLGTDSLKKQFIEAGLNTNEREPELAVLAYDTQVTYERLTAFCDLVRKGLPYIATHPDINCPVEGGFAPDAGAFMALIEASAGRKPDIVIGKPNPLIIEGAAERLNVSTQDVVMVGDRLYTDIMLGSTAGVGTVLVLSGETTPEDMGASVVKPDLVCQDLGDLRRYLASE